MPAGTVAAGDEDDELGLRPISSRSSPMRHTFAFLHHMTSFAPLAKNPRLYFVDVSAHPLMMQSRVILGRNARVIDADDLSNSDETSLVRYNTAPSSLSSAIKAIKTTPKPAKGVLKKVSSFENPGLPNTIIMDQASHTNTQWTCTSELGLQCLYLKTLTEVFIRIHLNRYTDLCCTTTTTASFARSVSFNANPVPEAATSDHAVAVFDEHAGDQAYSGLLIEVTLPHDDSCTLQLRCACVRTGCPSG